MDSDERDGFPSAVPAAIEAVLDAIKGGAKFVACADIRSFFTRIPKSAVIDIVRSVVGDEDLISFFREAIEVELSNMAELREKATEFPIEDIGVAQGNSLSPLLGNLILADFDLRMNEGDCRCIRYIDDFIILAPTAKAANAQLRKAENLLRALGMELSAEKTSRGATRIQDGFDFLGINVMPGLIRPSANAQRRLLVSIEAQVCESQKAFESLRSGDGFDRSRSLIGTLKRIDGMIEGWGKHYWFCNDERTFGSLDNRIVELIRALLGSYSDVRQRTTSRDRQSLLGITELSRIARSPFTYPSPLTGLPLIKSVVAGTAELRP